MSIPATWFPILVAAFLAALTFWLSQIAGQAGQEGRPAAGHVPDLIVDRFVATAFDPQGHPRHTLSASRMQHYLDDDSAELLAPDVKQQAPGLPSLHIQARRGKVSSKGEHVFLIQNVRLERQAMQGVAPLVMTTSYLQVTPDAQQIRTDHPVRLMQGRNLLTGDSLFMDGKARVMQLKGHVRGVYEVHR